ncbi:NAD(P)-dependent oxidoreductase [Jeotgalibacillus sp. S-D1]|uniref:NAD(P)-dependent oxidoreductase n=1 Tax=Jeotgalibacillus sp. S-D1 TaxID=2552189 RepID=UPI001059FCD0|nr:NAD(P)-dependent oxidoreductase [Jeotgalibacillus sp. S-D1]TDL35220.1 NAD(P)-dependent oxidoreductase [Jeotgalibacillus sp. S-D1]
MTKWKIGFIGTGVMGSGVISHLLNAQQDVLIYSRTKSKAEPLIEKGAVWKDSPAEIAKSCNLIFTMAGYPKDVEELYLNEDGLITNAKEGAVLVDLTTSTPSLANRIALIASNHGLSTIDAPVSGGDVGARNATLSIMAGGEQSTFEEILPILELFGSNIIYHGPAGFGQHVKMSNQIVIASTMIGVCESLAYAKKAGLNLDHVLKSIANGAAGSWSLSNLAPRMLKEDYEPGFYVRHFIKDLNIAIEEAKRMDLNLPGLDLACSLYNEISSEGYSDNGTQVLIKHYIN